MSNSILDTIQTVMKEKGISVEDLAEMLSENKDTILAMLSGTKIMSQEQLAKISGILGMAGGSASHGTADTKKIGKDNDEGGLLDSLKDTLSHGGTEELLKNAGGLAGLFGGKKN